MIGMQRSRRGLIRAAAGLSLCAFCLGGDAASGQDGAEFTDPAPPELRVLEAQAAPEAVQFDELTVHAAPRPLSPDAVIEDWPSFMGPRRDGHCIETGLIRSFDRSGPTLLWEMERGQGFASPVVQDGLVVFTHRQGNETHIDCLELETGRRFWRHTVPCHYQGEYIEDSGPRATPAIANGKVFVHDVEGRLIALELETGRVVWERNTTREFDVPDSFFGVVSSPLVVGDVLVQNLGVRNGPCVAAFDLETGLLAWGAGRKWGASCATPTLGELNGRSLLFVLTAGKTRPPVGGLVVVDPQTAEVVFEYPFRSRTYASVNGATPVVVDGGVLITASYGTGSAFLEMNEQGTFEERWRHRRFGLEFQTPLRIGERLIGIEGISGRAGSIISIQPGDGSIAWRADIDEEFTFDSHGSPRTISMSAGNGSLLWLGDRLLCVGDTGLLLLLELEDDGIRVTSRAALFFAGDTWTPPVISRGILLVCQNTPGRFGTGPPRLLAYDLRAK